MEEIFLSGISRVPSEVACSNTRTRWRCEHCWPACQCSQPPFAAANKTESPPSAAGVSEFRTQVRPQPSFTAPLVRPPLGIAARRPQRIRRGGRTSGRDGRLRSSTCSKLLCTGRGTRRLQLCSLPKGRPESQQAGQQCSQRRRIPVFEQAISFGTKLATIRIFCLSQGKQV